MSNLFYDRNFVPVLRVLKPGDHFFGTRPASPIASKSALIISDASEKFLHHGIASLASDNPVAEVF